MTVSPSGNLSLPLKYLRDTIAGSSTFQTWTSSANAAAALAHVYILVAASDYTNPCAVVEWESARWDLESRGTRNMFEQSGGLRIIFQDAISESAESDAAYDFTNNVGAILADMMVLAGTAAYLDIISMSMDSPKRPDEDERQTLTTDVYQAFVSVVFEGLE